MSYQRRTSLVAVLLAVAFTSGSHTAGADSPPARTFLVSPPALTLRGNFAQAQLVVTQSDLAGRIGASSPDLTREVAYASSNEAIVRVEGAGRLIAVANGQAVVTVSAAGTLREVPVTVAGVEAQPRINFLEQVEPVISKAGCNMGTCHAAQHGQAGFKLSVFGFDPAADWTEITRARQQRRVNYFDAAGSLFLQKPTMQVAHGGGRRLQAGSADYQLLQAWIATGAVGPDAKSAQVTRISVTPWGRIGQLGMQQQLRVEATYSDGALRDVTAWAKFDSMDNGVLDVSPAGLVTVVGQGQAPLLVRFEGQAEISRFVIPFAPSVQLAGWQSQNFIDELAAAKFRELGIEPAPLCDDATFIRRAMLDAIGTLPTPEETLAFIEAQDEAKRAKLVDRLLGLTGDPAQDIYNDQYAAFWTLRWSDLIRNNSRRIGEQGMWALHNWIRESFRTGKPFDQFVRELVTAKGSSYSNGPANYFRINGSPTDLTEATAQTFLGVRMECAKCHHHPFEKYSQDDYYGLAAFFSRIGSKNSEAFGLFGGESVVVVRAGGEVSNPRTGKVIPPTPLGGAAVDHPLDRRIPLADWLTSKENGLFARSIVNRYLDYLLGRGLVEPVDDMRETNPPSNAALMDALAADFAASGFDLKHLVRTIMTSRVYQLDSQPTGAADAAGKYYSFFQVKRLAAEPLLDAIDRATGVPTKHRNLPLGTRAIELPDAQYPNYFLTTFAKPRRERLCECERPTDENLSQALHTLNGDTLSDKIADNNGRVAKLVASGVPHETIVDQLYLTALSRLPTDAEREASREFLAESASPRECYEDLLWGLINSKQFLFVR